MTYERARDVSQEAVRLIETAGAEAAEARLAETLVWCPPAPEGSECRRPLLYALGYVYQKDAGLRPERRDSLLGVAFERFRDVFEENPDFQPAQEALAAISRQSPHESFEPTLRKMAGQDDTGRQYVLLGDYYSDPEVQRPKQALEAYRRAMELAPADERPVRRIIDLFRDTPETQLGSPELDSLLTDQLTVRFPRLAAEGRLVFMKRVYHRNPERAAAAVPDWLAAHAAADGVQPALASEMPSDWTVDPFPELRAFLADPAATQRSDWWLRDGERREAFARAALDLGRWALGREGPVAAERVWTTGLDVAQPGSASWLRITAGLAELYEKAPVVDPSGEKMRALERVLFDRKGEAIGRGDFPAMLRFHGTLGQIYARRGDWGSSGNPRSAIFQLEHALDAARRGALREPLPALRRWLAVAYERTDSADRAALMYAEAAADYLDVDDLAGADSALARSRELGRARAPQARTRAVTEWLRRRRAALDGKCDSAMVAGLRPLTSDTLPSAFEERQRFRTFADCSGRVRIGAPELAAEALRAALRSETPLVGLGDLVRIDEARRRVYGSFGQMVGPVGVGVAASAGDIGAVVTLPEDGRTLDLAFPRVDALIAAELVRALRPSERPVGALRLRVQDGQVTVIDPGALTRSELQALISTAGGRPN